MIQYTFTQTHTHAKIALFIQAMFSLLCPPDRRDAPSPARRCTHIHIARGLADRRNTERESEREPTRTCWRKVCLCLFSRGHPAKHCRFIIPWGNCSGSGSIYQPRYVWIRLSARSSHAVATSSRGCKRRIRICVRIVGKSHTMCFKNLIVISDTVRGYRIICTRRCAHASSFFV